MQKKNNLQKPEPFCKMRCGLNFLVTIKEGMFGEKKGEYL